MKISSIKDYIKEEFGPSMLEQGFRFAKKDFAFKKSVGKFRCDIYFMTLSWVYEVDLMPSVGISHHIIDDICEKCNFFVFRAAYVNLFVLEQIVLRNGKIGGDENLEHELGLNFSERFELSDFDQSKGVASIKSNLDTLLDLGVAFINKYATLQGLNKLYNTNPFEKYNHYCIGQHMHCFVGLILAKLCEDNYFYYRNIYKKRMEGIDTTNDIRISFNKLLELLDSMDSSEIMDEL